MAGIKDTLRDVFYRENLRRTNKRYTGGEKNDDEAFWNVDRDLYRRETGERDNQGMYYRMRNAIKNNDMDGFYESAEMILEHGGNADEEARTVTDALKAGTIDKNKAYDMVRYLYNKDEKTDDDVRKIVNGNRSGAARQNNNAREAIESAFRRKR